MNRKRSKSKVECTMPMVHPNAAAIDVGATMHMAAVRADRAPKKTHASTSSRYCPASTQLRNLHD